MKFFRLLKDWIIAHKVVSIIIAAALVVAVALAITLPIVLSHDHEFSAEWSFDNENHWHSCVGEDCDEVSDKAVHVYDNACDADCNVCGVARTPAEHVYDNACDADCNVCGVARTPAEHVYDNACDADCNVCGVARTPAEHVYDNACDADCNVCGVARTPAEHVYDNACDADCNVCGVARTPAEHVYDNACDADCNICGVARTPAEHVYDNACDADCNICGATRTPAEHVYSGAYDTTCDICGAVREVEGHEHSYSSEWSYDGDKHWHACTFDGCGEAADRAEHVYDGEADTGCNTCGNVRELPVRNQVDNEEEWQEAFDFKNMESFRIVTSSADKMLVLIRDGDVMGIIGYMRGTEGDTKVSEQYMIKDGESYYSIDWNGTEEPEYKRVDGITYEQYSAWFANADTITRGGLSFAEASYDAEGKVYRGEDESTYVGLTFVGGELTKIESSFPSPNPADGGVLYNTEAVFNEDEITVPEAHVLSASISYDETGHWYACADEGCTYKTTVREHEYDGVYDADCNICGATRTVDVHEHSYATAWSSDGTHHWHACTADGCGEVTDRAEHEYDGVCDEECNICDKTRRAQPHTYDNACDTDCNVCGEIRMVSPHPSSKWVYGDSGHWMACTECEAALSTAQAHVKAEESGGYDETSHWYKCTQEGCGYRFDEDTHTEAWNADATQHWKECEYCGYEMPAREAHVGGDTYQSNASEHWLVCTVCNSDYDSEEHTKQWQYDPTNHWSICLSCERKMDAEESHTKSTTYVSDPDGHWHACANENCEYTYDDTEAHTPKWTYDDEGHRCECEVCEYEIVAKTAHTESEEYQTSSSGHWKTCSVEGCEYTYASSKHIMLIGGDTCTVCHYKKSGGLTVMSLGDEDSKRKRV